MGYAYFWLWGGWKVFMINFKAENIKGYKELFNLSDELESLTDEIRNSFNAASVKNDFRRSKIPLYKSIFLYFSHTAMRQFPSIYILCAEGYAYSASPILRSLWENLVSVKYMLLDKNKNLNEEEANLKAQRFEEYRWVNMSKMLHYWKSNNGEINQKLCENIVSKEDEILNKIKEFKKTFKTNDVRSWSGLSIEAMAEKIDMLQDYNLLYRLCCNLSHPSFLGLQLGVVKGREKTNFFSGPSSEHLICVLETAITCFYEFLFLHDYLFLLGMTDKLKVFQQKARLVFESEKYRTKKELGNE